MDQMFYVAEPEPLVRLDLKGALISHFPSCKVMAESGLAAALGLDRTSVHCFIVNSVFMSDDIEALLQEFHLGGAHIVSTDRPFDFGFQSGFLEFPFTNGSVLDALSSMTSVPPVSRPVAHT